MRVYFFVLFSAFTLLLVAQDARAQTFDTAVASPFPVQGEVQDGDIITFDPAFSTYILASVPNDEHVFGVVVTDPTLFLSESGATTNGVPIVRFGEAVVNVSDLNGPIEVGDLISSSIIPGFGQKYDKRERGYVLGLALQPLATSSQILSTEVEGKTVHIGKIAVSLRIGPYTPSAALLGTGDGTGTGKELKDGEIAIEKGDAVFTVSRTVRYILAAIIAIIALFVAFKSFRGSMTQSIISVGRNPLAKTSILSMVFLNSILIVIVSVVALIIGAIIIFAP